MTRQLPQAQQRTNERDAILALIAALSFYRAYSVCDAKTFSKLYTGEHLSNQEIVRLADASRAGWPEALDRFGISRDGLPFGFDYLNHHLVKNGAEQAAIRMMRQFRAGGLSLQEIAGNLQGLIPTKQTRA